MYDLELDTIKEINWGWGGGGGGKCLEVFRKLLYFLGKFCQP